MRLFKWSLMVFCVLLLSFSSVLAVGTAPDPADTLAYWKLEDLTDSTPNAYTLTNGGGTSGVSGIINNAYSFTANTDYLTYSNILNAPTRGISVWINPTSWTTSNRVFGDRDGTGSNEVYLLAVGTKISFGGYWSGAPKFSLTSTSDIPLDEWTHIFAEYTPTGAKLYVNGVLEASNTYASSRPSATLPFRLGHWFGTSAIYQYYGKIDEVAIFTNESTLGNVLFLYNEGIPTSNQQYDFGRPADVLNAYAVMHYSFNDSGEDAVGALDATLAGGATYQSGHIANELFCNGGYADTGWYTFTTAGLSWTGYITPLADDLIQSQAVIYGNSNNADNWQLHIANGILTNNFYASGWKDLRANDIIFEAGTTYQIGTSVDNIGATGVIKLYVDGVMVNSSSFPAMTYRNKQTRFCTPSYTTTSNKYTGGIDEVTIYNTILPDTLFEYHYNITKDGLSTYLYSPVSNTAPVIDLNETTNTPPVYTDDTVNVHFNFTDADADDINITTTWFKSTDDVTYSAHTTDDETWTNQANATYFGTTYSTSATGDVEPSDTTKGEYWKAQITVTDGTATTSVNTTEVFIENSIPTVSSVSSGTSDLAPVNFGEDITFTYNGIDLDSDSVTLKVCSNNVNWSTCVELCEQTTPVTYDPSTPTAISCVYTSVETSRENTAYLFINDSEDESASSSVNYYVNQLPVLENFTIVDTTANTDFFFGESIDTITIDTYDADDTNTVILSVYDPDGVVKVSSQTMTLDTGNTHEYTTDLYLDAIGDWSVNISTTDGDGYQVWYNTTFAVSKATVNTTGRIYGYDFETLPLYSLVNQTISNYSYFISEFRFASSDSWTTVSDLVKTLKNNSQVSIPTFQTDLSTYATDITYIDTNYGDFIDGNHLNGIRYLNIYVADGVVENATNSALLNNLTKKMFQKVSNKFPIYIRNYNHTDIDTNYATVDDHVYISVATNSELLSTEIGYMRNTTDKSRIYYNLTNDLKVQANILQTNIYSKMRSDLNISTTYAPNIAELDNGDMIIINPNGSTEEYTITLHDVVVGSDIYDLTGKRIIENDADTSISLNVSSENMIMLYSTFLTSLKINEEADVFLYGRRAGVDTLTVDYLQSSANAFQFVSGSTNPDDARILLSDPSYEEAGFYVWYGTPGFEAVGNFSKYNIVVLGAGLHTTYPTFVGQTANVTKVFGYSAVNNYGDNNAPSGCTPGVDCTTWNRSAWIDSKITDLNAWANVQDNVNIFIDGLDIGAVNDVDGLFGDGLIELTNYVKNTLTREVILNTYTAYEDYANFGDYTMRESACGRWEGSEASPTYVYEDISLEIDRANFHKTHNVPVLAQTFGAITDYEKAYYCYMQTKVLYGDLAEFSYNQPLFDYTGATDGYMWNHYKYPSLGAELEEDFQTVDATSETYQRRFENGIVTINATDHTVTFENNEHIDEIEFCSYFYDNDDGASDEGHMRFIVNDNLSQAFIVNDSALTAFAKTEVCTNLTAYYTPTGWYDIEFYYLDADGDYTGNSGLFMYNGAIVGADRLSSYENILNDHPSNDETDYIHYATGTNWAVNFTIDRTTTESAIDEVTTSITQSVVGTEQVNVTLSSSTLWDLPVFDTVRLLNKTRFNGIFVDDTALNVSTVSCDVSNPTYGETLFASGLAETSTSTFNTNLEDWIDNGVTWIGWWANGGWGVNPGGLYFTSEYYIEKEFSSVQNVTVDAWNQVGGTSSLEVFINGVSLGSITTSEDDYTFVNPSPSTVDVVKIVGDGYLLDNVRVVTQGGEVWKACRYNQTGTENYVKVVAPLLYQTSYLIDGNTPPTITNESATLVSLNENNQSWIINYTATDFDENSILECIISIDGTNYTASPNVNQCSFTQNLALTNVTPVVSLYATDSYGDLSETIVNVTLAKVDYDGIFTSNVTGNLTEQHFIKYYNITQTNGEFSTISFDYDGLDAITLNITNGTTRDYLNFTTNLITYEDFNFTHNESDYYVVGRNEQVYRYFNVTGNLTTGEMIPNFAIELESSNFSVSNQLLNYACGSYVTYDNFTTNSTHLNLTTQEINNAETECYQYVLSAPIITVTAELSYEQNETNRTYNLNSDSGYGAQIDFLFDELRQTNITLDYSLSYVQLSNWDIKNTSSYLVYQYNTTDNYTLQTEVVNYAVVDDNETELLTFTWNNTGYPFENLFVNLTYMSVVTDYQCSDNIDNDGDGFIDYPDDSDCSSYFDDSEATASTPASGGGGGGFIPLAPVDDSFNIVGNITATVSKIPIKEYFLSQVSEKISFVKVYMVYLFTLLLFNIIGLLTIKHILPKRYIILGATIMAIGVSFLISLGVVI